MTRPGREPALDPERWERVVRLFDRAAELPRPEQDAWLELETGNDPALLETVRRMLAADRSDGDLLTEGVAQAAHLGLEPEASLLPGTQVGAFDVVGELGRGGMGVVYAALDRHLGRPAALKFLPPHGAGERDGAERLIAEAKAASALDHPNVATVYQVGETDDGRRFIAMPRYEGETLRARLARGPIPADEVLRIAREVAAGLAAAHRAGIVHRDVTPANIFLTCDGPVKLLDFGIAALAGSPRDAGTARGTVSSMSPEQARGEPTDARTDVWALGAVLFRMLTGEVPFSGDTTAATLGRLRGPEPGPRLAGRRGIPVRIARVTDRALQKDAAARYPDAGAMLRALEHAAAPRRARWTVAAGAMLVAAALLLAVLVTSRVRPAEQPSRPPTLVLLPLRSESGDPETAALADAVIDEVGRRLTMVGRLRVVGSDAGAAARASGPEHHELTVSLLGDGSGYRLHAVVRGTDPARTVWSESRRFDPAALRQLSRDLADGIFRALGLTLSAREHAALSAGFPSTVESYRAFLAGNQLLERRTPAAVLEGIERYRFAHGRDTAFVSALARHAYAISLLLDWGWTHPTLTRAELLAEGVGLSDRALALDPSSAEAWLARAYLMVAADPHRMRGAPEAFRQAIALDPYNAEAYHQYAQTEMQLGRLVEAATAYRRALELQPDAAMSLVSLAGIAELRGRRGEAARLLDSAVAVAPEMAYARVIRSLLRSYTGNFAAARADAAAALARDSVFRSPALAAMAMAVAGSGDTAAADEWMRRATAAIADPRAPTPDEAHMLAGALLALGRPAAAAEVVTGARPRGATLWYLFQHPSFAPLHEQPAAMAALAEADPRRE